MKTDRQKKQVQKLKKELKHIKLRIWILAVMLLVAAIILMIGVNIIVNGKVGLYPFSLFSVSEHQLTVEYRGMNDSQVEIARSLLEDVSPIYLAQQNKIIFTTHIKDYCAYCDGVNVFHKSLVSWSDNQSYMREVLCHELMHSFTFKSNEAHKVVYDLGQKQVCFGWQQDLKDYLGGDALEINLTNGSSINITLTKINEVSASKRTEVYIV